MLKLIHNTGSQRPTAAASHANLLADLAKAGFALRAGRVSIAATNVRRSRFAQALAVRP